MLALMNYYIAIYLMGAVIIIYFNLVDFSRFP